MPAGTAAAVSTVRSALQQAATQLGTEEVEPGLSPAEVLADSSSRTAVLARMLTLLDGLRPEKP